MFVFTVLMHLLIAKLMINILVLSTANSCRSQMAEGFLKNAIDSSKATVFSAGITPKPVNPRTIAIMEEDDIDISNQKSKSIGDVSEHHFDFIITLSNDTQKKHASISQSAKNIHYEFPDPAEVEGDENDIYSQFLTVREMIKMFCEDFVEENKLD